MYVYMHVAYRDASPAKYIKASMAADELWPLPSNL